MLEPDDWQGWKDSEDGWRHLWGLPCYRKTPPPETRYAVQVRVLRSAPLVTGQEWVSIRAERQTHPDQESAQAAFERALREARRIIEGTAL